MKTKIIQKNNKKFLEFEIKKEYDLSQDLDLMNTPISSLPDNLSVGGNLHLMNTLISSKSQVPKHLIKKVIGVDLK